MKRLHTRLILALFMLPLFAVSALAQESRVEVSNAYKNKDGKVITEEFTITGAEAEIFDVQKYVEDAQKKGEVVNLEVDKTDARGNRSRVVIQGDEEGDNGERVIVMPSDAPAVPGAPRDKRIITRKRITDKPGEVIIIDGDAPGDLPLPANARKGRKKEIRVEVDAREARETEQRGAQMEREAREIERQTERESRSIDRQVERDTRDMERQVERDTREMERQIEQEVRERMGTDDGTIRVIITKDGEEREMTIDVDGIVNDAVKGAERGIREMEFEFEQMGNNLENCVKRIDQGRSFSWAQGGGNTMRGGAHVSHDACLGVYPETVENKGGARVTSFTGYSPAEDGGIQEGDIITALNTTAVTDYGSLTQALAQYKVGEKVKVTYARGGKSMTTEVDLKSCNATDNEACLGVFTETFRQMDKKSGALINNFPGSSPARTSGLQEGDVIVAINNRVVKSEEALVHVLGNHKVSEVVEVKYIRNGETRTQRVKLKSCNDNGPEVRNLGAVRRDNCDENDAYLGVVSSITIESDGDETSRVGESAQGFLVSSVTPGGPAAAAGLQNGDVITSIDGQTILSFDDLEAFMAKQKPNNNVDVRFLRAGKSEQRTVQLKSCKDRNARERVIVSERGRGDRERRTIIIRKPANTDTRVNEAPTQPIKADERSLALTNFKTFPNPASGKVTVSFDGEALPTVVTIIDMAGRQLFTEELNTFNGTYTQEFDLTDYGNSTLVIRVTQGDKVYSDRVVVTK